MEEEQVAEQQQADECQQQHQQPERQENASVGPHGGDREQQQPRVLVGDTCGGGASSGASRGQGLAVGEGTPARERPSLPTQ